ncbi:uncharacterized protein LOC113862855 isoform X2 [Abrus precatorius]|uniref:Uncharacterized protein LOC113862855 isoform X2 n=1 Tax=Abrus precatorius TaxID=3816 RepID=A0A8B8L9D5_ABRPR|nr:uncharacterized protein LOC113862855 isoform X2 [Abrus precatorius]
MEDKICVCIIGEMDRLWFHQVILFSEPQASVFSLPTPPDEEKTVLLSESVSRSSSILSSPPPPDEETSNDESPSSEKQLSSESISVPLQDGSIKNEEETKERFARMNHFGNKIRSHSSSPSTQNHRRKFRKPATCAWKLQKSMSCKTLGELELDEVKGFMDLGFIFNRENLNPRMMSVVPGLQRLAWLIRRPDSPLLNLKFPKHCSSANMKKHLRFWAKIVASEIHQE